MSKRKPAPKDPKRAGKGRDSRRSRQSRDESSPERPSLAKPSPRHRGPTGRKPAAPLDQTGAASPSSAAAGRSDSYWLYGLHAVSAALANPRRLCHRLVAAPGSGPPREVLSGLPQDRRDLPTPESMPRGAIDALLPEGAVHQGIAMLTAPLPACGLQELLEKQTPAAGRKHRLLVALDQVTDPHNVGAILRSAAAFGAAGLILPERHSAPESGILAKVASGALDILPIARVGNLSRTLAALKADGFWCIGLAEEAEALLNSYRPDRDLVLILGAEGKGLRRLTRENCDLLLRLPTLPPIGSLNVSNAAAVALYALMHGGT